MPSRAVQKKLARREAKRSKQAASGDGAPVPFKREREVTPEETPSSLAVDNVRKAVVGRFVQRASEAVAAVAASSETTELQQKRRRVEAPTAIEAVASEGGVAKGIQSSPPEPTTAPQTHKERKKLEAKRKLERQMQRVAVDSARAVASAKTVGDTAAEAVATTSSSTSALSTLRHDPKFAHGTFWRDRKDKKKRTLFVGNLPSTSTTGTIKTLIDAIVVNTAAATDGENADPVATKTSVVESVDVLPKKYGSRVVHAYVTFVTIEDSVRAQTYLNGMEMGDNFLRVNNAADKQQRAVAIDKRNGVGNQKSGGRGWSSGRGRGQGRGGRGW